MKSGLLRFCWPRWALAAAVTILTTGLILPGTGAAAGTAASPGVAATSQPNTFVTTGQMAAGRSGQTATLLPDGKVLVAGGGSATAELYNPATGTFSESGSMPVDVTDATATLLPNGKVLVAGGLDTAGHQVTSAELYNPATGTWSPTGPMNTARSGQTATLLPDGQVLVAGGGCNAGHGFCDSGSFLNNLTSAELYNPATGTWTRTGSMAAGRQYQTATLLHDGDVLVTGGFSSCDDTACSDTNSAELYNPSTGKWASTGAMHLARQQHTATLLTNGDVLVAGGFTYFPDAIGPSGRLDSAAEIYDPTTGTWATTASMATTHAGHTATLLPNGWVLVAGGGTRVAEIYEPQRAIWVSPGTMSTARTGQTATLLPDGNVLVAGGSGAGNPGASLPTAELFRTGSGPLVRVTPGAITFPAQQVGSTSGTRSYTVVNDGSANLATSALRVTGTDPGDFHATTTCTQAPVAPGNSCTVSVRFAPATTGQRTAGVAVSDNAPLSPHGVTVTGFGGGPNVWVPASGPMSSPREDFAEVVLPDGKVLIAGGSNVITNVLASAELYNPATRSFSATGSLGTARAEPAAALLPDGQVLVAGGHTKIFADLASAELYNPATGTWHDTTAMNEPGHRLTATVLGDGNVLVAGFASGKAEVYHPATATWTDTGAIADEGAFMTATLLPDGKVLATDSGAGAAIYDPATNAWTATGSRHVASFGAVATLLPDGEVLLAGGHGGTGSEAALADAELFSPATGTWSTAQHMTVGRFGASMTLLTSGLAMVAGGCSGQCENAPGLSSAEVFNGTSWSQIASMPAPTVFGEAALLPGGDVLVAGGGRTANAASTNAAEVYTPAVLSAQPASGPPGHQVTLSGSNFYAGETVTLTWDGGQVLGHATTSVAGTFTAKVTIPNAAPGRHTLAARGTRSAATATTAFTVTG